MGGEFSIEAVKIFLKKNKALLRKKFGVKSSGIFGSFVKGKAKKSSDLDILVEFEEGFETFKNYMGLKFYLEESFGRKVDLVIIESIKPMLKEEILREAIYV